MGKAQWFFTRETADTGRTNTLCRHLPVLLHGLFGFVPCRLLWAQRQFKFAFALIVLFPVIASVMVSQSLSSIYIVPFAMIPIIVRIFLDSRTAFMAHVTIILLCSITLRFPHEFILLQVVAGMVSIYSLRELSQRSQLLRTALVVLPVMHCCILLLSWFTKMIWPSWIHVCISTLW